MAEELLARGPGRFHRGNLHCHSSASDGALSARELVAAYRDAGYDFVVVTDHFEQRYGWPVTDTRALRDERCTTLVGAELSATADWSDPGCFWVAAIGLPPGFEPPPPGDHGEALERAAAAGAFLCLLHPGLNGLQPEAATALHRFELLHAVELYTHQSSIYRPDTAIAVPFADALLAGGRRLGLVAADDAHFRDGPDAFGAWVEVHAPGNAPEQLLAALKAGSYYATQGPALTSLARGGDQLRVACSPCARILLTGPSERWRRWRWRLAGGRADGGGTVAPLTEAVFDLAPFAGGFCRVTIVDGAGRRAWSNPIWL